MHHLLSSKHFGDQLRKAGSKIFHHGSMPPDHLEFERSRFVFKFASGFSGSIFLFTRRPPWCWNAPDTPELRNSHILDCEFAGASPPAPKKEPFCSLFWAEDLIEAGVAMASSDTDFIVWGIDQTPYGPVELPTLVSWVKDERVTAETWVFAARTASWQKAPQVPELQMFFRPKSNGSPVGSTIESVAGVDPRALRRVKILGGMSEEQLQRFVEFMEIEKAPQWSVIVKQGDPGDTMYLILQGELRVRINVAGKETILTTLGVGDFFGDISLFDQGPRSADVVANSDSILLKISSSAFEELSKKAPELATPFLRNIGRTLSARIRADNKRLSDAVRLS